MKTRLSTLVVSAVFLSLSLTPIAVSAQGTGFYLRGDAGGVWTMDADLEEFFGEPLSGGAKVEFDAGPRFAIAAGYNVTDWFSVEGQTGFMINENDTMTDATDGEAFFSNVPLLLNARVQCPAECRLVPYIGGGVGMSAAVIDADDVVIGGTRMDGAESTVVFAYQAFGGLRLRINERMSVGVEYRYFGTTEPEWEAESTFGTADDELRFGRIQSHSVSVIFEFSF